MFEKLRSFIDNFKGVGHCEHCKLSWNIVEGYTIPYNNKLPLFSGSSMFPICIKCFKKLQPSQIFTYCQSLVNKWHKKVDMEIVKYNIEYLKNLE